MYISFRDAQRLWSGIWHKEELVNKKRRWLMQLSSQDTSEVDLKKLKKSWSLSNAFLAESFVRRDEASSQAVKINVERNYKALCYNEERLPDFHNYMVLSDVYILQSFLMEPFNLAKFHSTLDLLSNNALSLLANLVTDDKINFERNHRTVKEVLKTHFSEVLSASKALIATLRQLYEILRNHENYKEKQPSLMTPASSSSLFSIDKALELLDSMPIFALRALNRKLIGKKMIPRFPPSKIGYNKKELVKRIRSICCKLIRTLNNENSMPEELVKAMSIIHLYFKYKTKTYDTFATKFLSFSLETVILQNNILKALWSIPKVAPNQMKALHAILGVKLEDYSGSFLNDLKHYLLQYLLECDEIEVPSDVSNVLAILNQSSCSQPQICSNETIEVEKDAVLNVSMELSQIVSHFVSGTSTIERDAEGLESDDDTDSNDFELVENDYCSNTESARQQKNAFSKNGDLESTGDSMPSTYFNSATSDSCSFVLDSEKSINNGFAKKLKQEQDDVDDLIPHYKEPMETSFQGTQGSNDCRDVSIKELCDETSLVSYRLIGHMLNSFLLVEGRDVDVATRHHLTGEALHSTTFQADTIDMLDFSGKNVAIKALLHSIEDLLPSIPKRCTQRVEMLMKQP